MSAVTCPNCASRLRLPDDSRATRVSCPKCKQPFDVADAQEPDWPAEAPEPTVPEPPRPAPPKPAPVAPQSPAPPAPRPSVSPFTIRPSRILRGLVWVGLILWTGVLIVGFRRAVVGDDSAIRHAAHATEACLLLMGGYVVVRAIDTLSRD